LQSQRFRDRRERPRRADQALRADFGTPLDGSTQFAQLAFAGVGDVVAIEQNSTGVRGHKPEQKSQKSGFA